MQRIKLHIITKITKQAGAELSQTQPQLGLRMTIMEIYHYNENSSL